MTTRKVILWALGAGALAFAHLAAWLMWHEAPKTQFGAALLLLMTYVVAFLIIAVGA